MEFRNINTFLSVAELQSFQKPQISWATPSQMFLCKYSSLNRN